MVRRIIPCRSCSLKFVSYEESQMQCLGCADKEEQPPPSKQQQQEQQQQKWSPIVFDLYTNEEEEEEDDDYKPPPVNSGQPNQAESTASIIDLQTDDNDGVCSETGEEDLLSEKNESNNNNNNNDLECTLAFQGQQQRLHAQSTLQQNTMQPPQARNAFETCLVCGKSLSHIKTGYQGRLNHVKRCSKQQGVSIRDFVHYDDTEIFTSSSSSSTDENTANTQTTGSLVNPYLRNQWHGGGNEAKEVAPSTNQILMAGARRAAKMQQLKKPVQRQPVHNNNRWGQRSHADCPFYKKIPGTDFCVDGFQYGSPELTNKYFLTHFHSDHYGGITKSWAAGIIYCSFPTANLVSDQLGVDRRFIQPLPMSTPTVIESKGKGVKVTLLNANHCPGAVMFLFEVGNRVILHVGDFRWNYDIMSKQPALSPFCRKPWCNAANRRRIDDIFLDTTYCDDKYCLPTQAACIEACVQQALKEVNRAQSERKRLVMVFGAYTIGKEAVYMAVAERLKMKVYVDKRRFRILSQFDWSTQEMSLFTTNQAESILWVVPLGDVNLKKLSTYQSVRTGQFARDFDLVVGFRPTGWSMSSKKSKSDVLGTQTRGNLTVHSVPYSEHSSFPELVECIESLNPKGRIIPTVSASKSQHQVDLLLSYWRDKKAKLI